MKENLKNGQFRIVYLWGPAGSGKTHCLVASMRYLSAQGKSIEFLKADQIHDTRNIRVGHSSALEKFIEVLAPNIFIDDFNESDGFLRDFFKQLVLWAFDFGGKKIMITSNMSPVNFIHAITHKTTTNGINGASVKIVKSKEADRLLSRFNAMAQIINFEGVPCMRHNWLDERYDDVDSIFIKEPGLIYFFRPGFLVRDSQNTRIKKSQT